MDCCGHGQSLQCLFVLDLITENSSEVGGGGPGGDTVLEMLLYSFKALGSSPNIKECTAGGSRAPSSVGLLFLRLLSIHFLVK